MYSRGIKISGNIIMFPKSPKNKLFQKYTNHNIVSSKQLLIYLFTFPNSNDKFLPPQSGQLRAQTKIHLFLDTLRGICLSGSSILHSH
jgi:hypothetical protein